MKNNLLLFVCLLVSLFGLLQSALAQTPVSWLRTLQIGGTRTDQVYATTTDLSGNTYQTGYFIGTTQCGNQSLTMSGTATYDMYVVKSDVAGNVLWARQAGSQSNVATSPTNSVYGTAEGSELATDAQGNIYVSGFFRGEVTFGNGSSTLTASGNAPAIFVAKYSAQGVVQWTRKMQAGSSTLADATGLAVSNAGDVYVAGFYSNSLTVGSTTLTSNGQEDVFLTKYSAVGTEQWVRGGGGTGTDYGYSVKVTATNTVYLTGIFTGTLTLGGVSATGFGQTDMFLAQYNDQGTTQWVRAYGGADAEYAGELAIAATGELYVAGSFSGLAQFGNQTLLSNGSTDGCLLKCDAQGNPVWVAQTGGVGRDYALYLLLHPSGNVYVSGSFESTSYFGNQTLTSTGSSDVYLVRYAGSGQPAWATQLGGSAADSPGGLSFNPSGGLRASVQFSGSIQLGAFNVTSRGGTDVLLAYFQDNVPLAQTASKDIASFTVSPNPASDGYVCLRGLPLGSSVEVRVLNALGQTVSNSQQVGGQTGEIRVSIQGLAPGSYIIQFIIGASVCNKKITINN